MGPPLPPSWPPNLFSSVHIPIHCCVSVSSSTRAQGGRACLPARTPLASHAARRRLQWLHTLPCSSFPADRFYLLPNQIFSLSETRIISCTSFQRSLILATFRECQSHAGTRGEKMCPRLCGWVPSVTAEIGAHTVKGRARGITAKAIVMALSRVFAVAFSLEKHFCICFPYLTLRMILEGRKCCDTRESPWVHTVGCGGSSWPTSRDSKQMHCVCFLLHCITFSLRV